jgi:predicted acyl esterase
MRRSVVHDRPGITVPSRHHRLAVGVAAATVLVTGFAAAPAGAAVKTARPVEAHGSVDQVYVVGATPGAAVTLRRAGSTVAKGTIDDLGGFVFRDVDPGNGYRVAVAGLATSKPLTVTDAAATPPNSLYSKQELDDGYGYLTTRDGTLLSVDVSLPGPADKGPYPVLMEYSGYDPSNPTASLNPFQIIANLQGYAYVGVNMRGTGCSGGSFNFFEEIQSLDGYDAVETIAAQPWATGRVGLVGISYPGISQLFVAQTRPPHLAAITPLSVIDDTYRGTLYPGGIYNDGFAKDWAQQRLDQNRWPDPKGAKWVEQRVAEGDETCTENLRLRGQNVDLMQTIRDNPYYSTDGIPGYPKGFDSVAPARFVDRIEVPTFIAGAWQDEQTGGHWPEMIANFPKDIPLRVTAQNGTHTDSLDPEVVTRQLEFLDFYVARRIPEISPQLRGLAPQLWAQITGLTDVPVPADRFSDFTSYRTALKSFEAEPRVRILWENGAKPGASAGSPLPAAETTASTWPLPGTKAKVLYLAADGSLQTGAPDEAQSLSFNYEPNARPRKTYTGSGSGIWRATPTYDWVPLDSASSLSWITAPLARTTAIAGPGSVDLTLASTAADTDLEVTLTEVRPDGSEVYVQSGWLRASHRKLDAAGSTATDPRQTHLEADAKPLVPGRATKVRVALFPVAHVFRADSRIRISVQAPGGNRPLWTFETIQNTEPVRNTIVTGGPMASRLVLSQVRTPKGLPVPVPACPSLRGQACRTYVAPAVQTPGPAPK